MSTVKTRLQRALAALRARLDGRPGGRRGWLAALGPLALRPDAPHPGSPTWAWIGGLLSMKLAPAAAAAALALAAIAFLLSRSDGPDPGPAVSSALEQPAPEPAPRLHEPAPAEPAPVREELAAAPEPAPEEAGEAAPVAGAAEVVRGLLVGVDGEPLAGLRLRWFGPHAVRWGGHGGRDLMRGDVRIPIPPEREQAYRDDPRVFDSLEHPDQWRWALTGEAPPELETRTDAEGRFSYTVPLEQTGGSLELDELGWVFLGGGRRGEGPRAHELVLVGCPAVDLGGVVVDPGGAPIAAVSVLVIASFPSVHEFPLILDRRPLPDQTQVFTPERERWVSTGPDGRFAYTGAPRLTGGRLMLIQRGYENLVTPLPARSDLDLHFVLQPEPEEDWGRVAGRVLDPELRPVEDAEVCWHGYNTFTKEDGSFAFELESWFEVEEPLMAVKEGYRPAVVDDFGRRVARSREGHEDRTLVLGPPPLAIAGRVLDAAGEPQEGWCVALEDPTPKWELCVEEAVSGVRHPVVTDAEGRFAIGGLFERPYRLRVWHPETHLVVVSEPYPAGTREAAVHLPAGGFHERVTGRVVGLDGASVAGASVALCYEGVRVNRAGSTIRGEPVWTDAEGRFELARVPRAGVSIEVDDELVERERWPIEELGPPEDLVLRVRRLHRFRVELDPSDPADAFAVLNAEGTRLPVRVFLPELEFPAYYPSHVPRGEDGVFPVSEVSEAGVTLLVLERERELRRIDLHLVPGSVKIVRP